MPGSQEKTTYLGKEGLTFTISFCCGTEHLVFSSLNPFKQRSVPPCPSLLKGRQHMFGVDTADLANSRNREGQVKSKTCWCHASTNGRCCQWLFTEPPDQGWACLEDMVLSGVYHLRHTGVRDTDPLVLMTPPSTSRPVKTGPPALVRLHGFIIPFHSVFVVSVLHSKLFHCVSLCFTAFSLHPCLDSIKLLYIG